MSVRKSHFGIVDGENVEAWEIERAGLRARLLTYGAVLNELLVPDGEGGLTGIALGYDDIDSYLRYRGSAGAICGRYANRIANGRFELDGRSYELSLNEPPNHIHGGFKGFSKRLWQVEPDSSDDAVRLTLRRPDGDEGYPGAIVTHVTYRLTDEPALEILMEATSDRPTIVNLAYHGYWNLAGHDSGSIRDHVLTIDADHYTPVASGKIPTGEVAPVEGTLFDFRAGKRIGDAIFDRSCLSDGGYDHNFCLRGKAGGLRRAAHVVDPRSGRSLAIWTDQPGMQLYTANHFERLPASGRGGAVYGRHCGLALETQIYPNAPNVPHFPSPVLRPGEVYRHVMRIPFHLG
jgi:aldose 1-epimerase